MQSTLSNNAEQFVPDKDLIETLEDGRTVQAAVKGVPIPRAEAVRLGLVKEEKSQAPNANKATAPAENKAAK